uniref:Uncharacterized protein n=1 Tax=Parastrongyloides trichosuri TaxID=131310 RepID=A0A0N4ZGM9_PARTI
MIFFKSFLILFLFHQSTIQDSLKCSSCASIDLNVNWGATTLPYPKNTSNFFSVDCNNRGGNKNYVENCPSPCFSMVVTSNSQIQVVRGCMSDFFQSSVIQNATEKMVNNDYCLTNQDNVPDTSKFFIRYCNSSDCNSEFNLSDFVTKCDKKIPSGTNTCYSCSRTYGSGECKPEEGSTCTGTYCVKVSGHYGDAKFEERRCSEINPYMSNTCVDVETSFPLSLTSSITANEVCYTKN